MIRRLLPILLLLFCCPTIYAQNKQILPTHGNRHNGLSVKESSRNRIKMSANIGAISLNDTTTKKGDFIELQADGTYISGAEGEPQLPALRKLVEMPVGSKPIITIKHADTAIYILSDLGTDRKLSPRQPFQSKIGKEQKFKYKKRSYRRNYFTQNELVTIRSIGSMRGVEICQVNVNPVRYNPKQNTLMVLNNIEFDVDFDGGTAKSGAKDTSPYFDGVYSSLGNHKSLTTPSNHPVKYLIITDTAFVGALADFITLKRQKGFNVVVATTDTIGNFANDIKEWVSTQYHSATDDNPAPSFLLLAADTDKIPASQTGTVTGYGTDLYYACMDGEGDNIPDMYYGRFSARTAEQMKAIVDKTITYEKYEFEDPSYLSKATLIAGYDGTWRSAVGIPTVNYIANNRINAKNGYNKVKKFTSSYSDCYADSCVAVGLMTYTAHGETTEWVDPELSQNKVRNFGYRGQFPFVVANCCLSGQYTKEECLGETWLRKENSGAVAYIGSSPKTYWYPDFYWAVGAHKGSSGVCPDTSATTTGAFDMPFVSNYVCGGAFMFTGNMAVTEACDNGYPSGMSGNWDIYYWEGYNYLGDPSLLVYFGEPKDNTVSHGITIPVNSTIVNVSASSGSYIALSYNGERLGAAYVPEGENSTNITIKPVSDPCAIDVIVTKPRYKPYFGTITAILPDEPYLAIMDNPFKNNNLQSGCSANFNVVVSNLGQQASQTATVSITSQSPLVKNVSANQTTLSSISGTTNSTLTGLCHIELNSNITDGTKIPFRFSVTEGGRTTNSEFSLNVTAPKLKLNATATIDNPNHLMFPGDTADILIRITNSGHAIADMATVKLTADDEHPMVQIFNSEQTISNLNPGDTAICRFSITADEYAEIMTLFKFKITASASEPLHSDSCIYTVTIGHLEDKIIGNGSYTVYYYPFYNYYKTSRTQIIYTAADLGNKPIRIDEIAFPFYYITPEGKFEGFKNFTLKMKYYQSDNLKSLSNFIDMSDAETVLKMDLMNIESKELNLKFDKPFIYNGTGNVLLEIGWGQNVNYVDKDYSPDIYYHTTQNASIASGYSDDPSTPDGITEIKQNSTKRPNTIFRYQKPKYVFIDAKDAYGQPFAGVEFIVNADTLRTNNSGVANTFVFGNLKTPYQLHSLEYLLEDENIVKHGDTISISLQLRQLNVHTATFHVVDSETLRNIPDVLVSVSGHNITTDEDGWATFDRIPNMNKDYSITADQYIPATGTININSDTVIVIYMTKMPHVTFCVHNNDTAVANVQINIGGSLLTTDNNGNALFYTTKTDTIPYSIIVGAQILTDTIWSLQKSATVSINLALLKTIQPTDTTNPGDTITKPIICLITFYLSDGSTPLADATVSMNNIAKTTDSLGIVKFDSIFAGTDISYTISKLGYQTIDGQTELSGSFTLFGNTNVTITLKAVEQPPVSAINNMTSEIIVYPNPSDGLFYIQNCDIQKVSIFDQNGKLVKIVTSDNNKIDLRPIVPGLYTLIIETPAGNVSTQIVVH